MRLASSLLCSRNYFDDPRPRYIVPDGEVGQQAFAVIREAIRQEGMVAIGKVVFTSREHIIALEARDKGLLGVTLRYPYEVRKEADYFDDIADEKLPKDMLDLAKHIVDSKKAEWKPERFEDQYEDALKELLEEEAIRPEDRGAARSRAFEGGQSHGCVTSFGGNRTWWRRTSEATARDHRAPKKAGRSSARAKKAS